MASGARRALIVEDDEGIAELWGFGLAEDGFAVERRDSALGVAALLRRWRPDVVLLDLGLPYRSGASLLAELKSDPATAGIPVVIVSAAPDALPAEYRGLAAALDVPPAAVAEFRGGLGLSSADAARADGRVGEE